MVPMPSCCGGRTLVASAGAAPVADFTATPLTASAGAAEAFLLTDTSTGGPFDNYEWEYRLPTGDNAWHSVGGGPDPSFSSINPNAEEMRDTAGGIGSFDIRHRVSTAASGWSSWTVKVAYVTVTA